MIAMLLYGVQMIWVDAAAWLDHKIRDATSSKTPSWV